MLFGEIMDDKNEDAPSQADLNALYQLISELYAYLAEQPGVEAQDFTAAIEEHAEALSIPL